MGPLSTVDFFYRVVDRTDAQGDSGHIHVIVDSDAGIPDRTECILKGDNGCLEAIIRSAKRLHAAGAEVIAMPCNTAHAFLKEIRDSVPGTVFLDMVKLTVREMARRGIRTAALLATEGTIKSGIYELECEKTGIRMMLPGEEGRKEVTDVIYTAVKAGREYDSARFIKMLEKLRKEGAEAFILGCTELPIAFDRFGIDLPYVDSTEVLAEEAIRACGYDLK